MLKVFLRKNINALPFLLSKTNWHSLNDNKKCFIYFIVCYTEKESKMDLQGRIQKPDWGKAGANFISLTDDRRRPKTHMHDNYVQFWSA